MKRRIVAVCVVISAASAAGNVALVISGHPARYAAAAIVSASLGLVCGLVYLRDEEPVVTAPGWRALLVLEQSLVELQRDVHAESAMTDHLAGELLMQVVVLEEIVAAPWPRSMILRARLRRDLRASVKHVQGATWTDRRIEALGTGWLERRP